MASANSANPQTFNRYTYALNNPLVLVDRSGGFPEFSFSLYVRAFAPFDRFGPGRMAQGDNRGFSIEPTASYRIQSYADITMGGSQTWFPQYTVRASPPVESQNQLWFLSNSASSECWINDPQLGEGFGADYLSRMNNNDNSLNYSMFGNDDAIPGSSDIDLHNNFTFSPQDLGNGVINMTIAGSVTGDQFPAAEAFIRDSQGNSVMLGVFAPTADSGPVTSLPLDKSAPMIDVNVTVQVKNGVFQGVVENGNLVSLDEYNKRFLNQPAVKPN